MKILIFNPPASCTPLGVLVRIFAEPEKLSLQGNEQGNQMPVY